MIGSKVFFAVPQLSLILGGARSGKSALAERLVAATGLPRIYIATAEPGDDEMQDRIRRHRGDRGQDWQTIEAPLDVVGALATIPNRHIILLDCATLWLSNQLLADRDLDREGAALIAGLRACASPVIIVSNEVGWSIVPENALARRFRDAQGRLNQKLAGQAGLVVGVMAGLPMALKGDLPDILGPDHDL